MARLSGEGLHSETKFADIEAPYISMEAHLAGAGFAMVLGTQNWALGKQHCHGDLLATLQPQDVLLLTGRWAWAVCNSSGFALGLAYALDWHSTSVSSASLPTPPLRTPPWLQCLACRATGNTHLAPS